MAAVTVVPNATPGLLGIINIGGQVVPLLSVGEFFRGLEAPRLSAEQVMILVHCAGRELALLAEHIEGVVSVDPVAMVEPAAIAPSLRGLAGVVKRGDGLVLLPDLEAIFMGDPHRPYQPGLLAAA